MSLRSVLGLLAAGALSSTAIFACGTEVTESTDRAEGAIEQLPNETAWAEGTRWTYEQSFVGLKAWVYRPASFSQKAPEQRGVIFHLLGCGQLTYQVAQGSGWPEAAEAAGMVIVVPEMVAPVQPNQQAPNTSCYNFGSNLAMQPTANSPDHKALINAARKIGSTFPELKIDPRQVYFTGLSAGATVAMQVACMAPDAIAGVGSVAGPAIGADQSRAVMPPTVTADQVRRKCTSYAGSLQSHLGTQLYAVVSDDNGLPAGNPVLVGGVWTADKFQKQTIWDGDKYVPHAYHGIITGAMAPLFNATAAARDVDLGFAGTGIGCPRGEASHGDTAETECRVADFVTRGWRAKADVWKDREGRERIVHITQDTLRHRWPSGPVGRFDRPVTPTREQLIADGYINTADGSFVIEKLNRAPNGQVGIIFIGTDTFDFPRWFTQYLSTNNPRLPR